MKLEMIEWSILVGQICVLPLVAYVAKASWILREHGQSLAGELMLKVPRPRVQRWEKAQLIVTLIVLLGQAAGCAYLLTTSGPVSVELLRCLTWFLFALIMVIGNAPEFRGRSYLEFRARGILCGSVYLPWESIESAAWSEPGCVLKLKLRLRNAILNYALRRNDKAAVQMKLDEHMIGTSETSLSHPTSRPTERV
jgi:hypothetical protein